MPEGGRYHLRSLERKNVYVSVDVPETARSAADEPELGNEAYRSALSRIGGLVQARKPVQAPAPAAGPPITGLGSVLKRWGALSTCGGCSRIDQPGLKRSPYRR